MGSCKKEDMLLENTWVYFHGAIIIGAGPSGLATSACLKQHGVTSLILEKSECVASLWQHRTYDRMKLHLPKQFCQLPLLNFPTNYPTYPTRNQFISYIEDYASHFETDIKFNQTVENAEFDHGHGLWRIRTQDLLYMSRWLVVATGENAVPVVPEIVGMERFHGDIIHSSKYRSGFEFSNKNVLVVGCGNSGMEVSLDLCNYNANAYMAVRTAVHVLPREIFGLSTFGLAMTLLKWLPVRLVDNILLLGAKLVLGDTNRFGLPRPKTGPLELKNATGKTPVLDVGTFSQIKSGKIMVMKGVKEITKTGAKFLDGLEKDFDAIIMATGYKSNVPSWVKGGDFTEEGMPKNRFPNGWKGENGLYTVGFSRRGLLGSASDAINIAKDIYDQWVSSAM